MSSPGTQLAGQPATSSPPKDRSPLAHLLHALNQPLTGLQCLLELAVAGPRSSERYLETLGDALELTRRMRILVEALRELADLQEANAKQADNLLLDALLRETADDLRPVAETRKVRLLLACNVALPVRSSRGCLATLIFRSLESPLSMAREESDLRVTAEREREQAVLSVSWSPAPPLQDSPFSQPELGLLIAQVGWERAGAQWFQAQSGDKHTCTIRLALASPQPASTGAPEES